MAGCSSRVDPSPDAATPEPSPAVTTARTGAKPTVVFAQNGSVYRLERDRARHLMDVRGSGFSLSADGKQFAYTDRRGNRHVIVAGKVPGPKETVLGPGTQPTWSPDHSLVAAVAPARGYTICDVPGQKGERPRGCFEGERVVVYDPAKPGPGEHALGADDWNIVGWTSGHKVLAASKPRRSLSLAFPGATFTEREEVPYVPEELWGISPAEPVVLIHAEVGTEVVGLEDGARTKVEIGDATLGAGAWSPDGALIATVLHTSDVTSLIVIEAESGAITQVPDSDGAYGSVVWSTDSQWFAFLRKAGDTRLVLCDRELTCQSEGSPLRNGSRLLALI